MINYERLERILQHELRSGCGNRAVINGLESFVLVWREQSLAQSTGDDERARVGAIAAGLDGYAALEVPQREESLRRVLSMLADGGPVARAPTAASQPPQTPRPAAPPAAASARPVPPPRRERAPARAAPVANLSVPVTAVRGVAAANAVKLAKLGIATVDDLLNYYPRRHVDYSALKTIDHLVFGEDVTVIGTVTEVKTFETRRGLRITDVTISDDTGAFIARYFQAPYLRQRLRPGHLISVSGRVGEHLGRIVMSAPEWELVQPDMLRSGKIIAHYRLTEGVYPRTFREIIRHAVDTFAGTAADHLPMGMRQRARLLDLPTTLRQIHAPESMQMLEKARRRLAFDEFLLIQMNVLRQRKQWQSQPALPLPGDEHALDPFIGGLPFPLTGAQQRVIDEIRRDMGQPIPMSRLLQGDVGAGKTVVAAAAAQVALHNGRQVAIMAPTEILADQHFRTFTRLFGGAVAIRLLTGSQSKKEKDAVKAEIANGAAQIVVGTHALIQDGVDFKALSLVVVDEQHRFGVEQRATLRQKGFNPHMLVMTATPIPRTLSLTLYGDLDLSVLDELPPGRQPIVTSVRAPSERERTYAFIAGQVRQGRQAFVICPLVEESDKLESKAAVAEHKRLESDVFPTLKLGLLHGRMKGSEKDDVMRGFLNREYDILVSTSVVEVGIDVPNASVMLIEGANRFGLSQLHQFRGRVGRGPHASYCVLLADSETEQSLQRLAIMEQTQDGFRLAEEDLKMRGPGEFFGTRQSGIPDLHVAQLTDVRVLEDARQEAQSLFARDPELQAPEHELLARRLAQRLRASGDLS
ncbi:MAG: ATP-dependent DNA helicase RecG [Chloroflexi bacterium]|nr:ATP-dependent DNA helicase RecG [Chloroflexota bacterium]